MELDGISDRLESTNLHQALTSNSTEWNGKDVRTCSTIEDAWLVAKIPFNEQASSLEGKITSVNSRTLPTVKQVLAQHNLSFAPTSLGKREIEQLPASSHSWIIIPLQTSEAPSLKEKVTEIDTNDHRTIEKVLERSGWFAPIETDPFFFMTIPYSV